ncbi:MAG: trans-aconitate 2-methyltransferase [Nitrospirales bacterium]|nr:class I SAM-dependent methyltransferase [Nitrospirales bacterium]
MTAPIGHSLVTRLEEYLHSWGLREFHDESSYYQWQRTCLNRDQLLAFEELLKRRTKEGGGDADIEFYDLLAQPIILPVLYSQRYDYYRKIGVVLYRRIAEGSRVLDFGCGVGILTTFLAQEFPNIEFVGVDRSAQSISIAEQEANRCHVKNVSYFVRHIPSEPLPGSYDVVLSTQAVFQSEGHSGPPSMGWQTFRRPYSLQEQVTLEMQLGLAPRLDALQAVLQRNGRMILFEKTGHLGRRILFQRALSRRGFHPVHEPLAIAYHSIDEQVVDGPLYEVSQAAVGNSALWNEEPNRRPGDSLYGCSGRVARRMGSILMGNENREHGQLKSIRWGMCRISLGKWQEALAYLLFEADSGTSAILVGGLLELSILTDIFEQLMKMPAEQVDQFIADTWGNLLNESNEEERPGYENHFSSAQAIYMALPSKVLEKEFSFSGSEGKSMHLEFGKTMSLWYFYWANTFDQRQLVLVDYSGERMLRTYFEDSLKDLKAQIS